MSSTMVRRPSVGSLTRWAVLLGAAVYFFGPLLAAITFTVHAPGKGFSLDAYSQIFAKPETGQIGFTSALTFSLLLSLVVIVFTLALMVPTQILLHLYLPRLRRVVEIVCLLPLVFPPVVLVVGISNIYKTAEPHGGPVFSFLSWMRDANHPGLLVALYSVMALPFVYRAIDAGLEAIDLTTLVEAARNLGASWWTTIVTVLLPSLRTALVSAGFLCFALSMGEYTVAAILLYTKPFPVWLAQLPTSSGQVQAAVSVFSLLLVEAALLLVSVLGVHRSPKGQS
jgi:putative spermidine/putrescine transport system permease protein